MIGETEIINEIGRMKRRKGKGFRILLAMLIGAIVTMSGCGSTSSRMMFGTGGTAGTYYAYGGVLAQYMRNYAG